MHNEVEVLRGLVAVHKRVEVCAEWSIDTGHFQLILSGGASLQKRGERTEKTDQGGISSVSSVRSFGFLQILMRRASNHSLLVSVRKLEQWRYLGRKLRDSVLQQYFDYSACFTCIQNVIVGSIYFEREKSMTAATLQNCSIGASSLSTTETPNLTKRYKQAMPSLGICLSLATVIESISFIALSHCTANQKAPEVFSVTNLTSWES